MKAFTDSISYPSLVDNVKPEFSGRKLFNWNSSLGSVVTFSQKTAMRYRLIKRPGYGFEYTRYDTYTRDNTIPSTNIYGASGWSKNWDILLTDKVKLGIEQAASWEPTVDNFFPTDEMSGTASTLDEGAGLRSFLKGMKEVAELIDCTVP